MRHVSTFIVTAVFVCIMSIQAYGKDEPPADAKKSFLDGIVQLKKQASQIFNEESLPALKPIKDIVISSEFVRTEPKNELKGFIKVRIQTTKYSGHVKLFWLRLQDCKWIVTDCAMEPWEKDKPSKVQIYKRETEQFVEKVQSCFNNP